MFILTKKIVIAILAFCSVQFDACCSDSNNGMVERVDKRLLVSTAVLVPEEPAEPRFQDGLPRDVLKLIFEESSKAGADPRVLERVCKYWHKSMRFIIPGNGFLPTVGITGIPYTTEK